MKCLPGIVIIKAMINDLHGQVMIIKTVLPGQIGCRHKAIVAATNHNCFILLPVDHGDDCDDDDTCNDYFVPSNRSTKNKVTRMTKIRPFIKMMMAMHLGGPLLSVLLPSTEILVSALCTVCTVPRTGQTIIRLFCVGGKYFWKIIKIKRNQEKPTKQGKKAKEDQQCNGRLWKD